MRDKVTNPPGDEGDATRRLVEQIAAQIEEHMRTRPPRRTRRRTEPDKRRDVHQMPPLRSTVFNGPIVGSTINVGQDSGLAPEIALLRRALQNVLNRLPEAELDEKEERAVREDTETALAETVSVQPQPWKMRRLVATISSALITGVTSGGANPIATELVKQLQQASL